ncbi:MULTISPECIES: DUF5610 domain-containing protein [Colwellia]|uniref:DUF5610 domain-containing protein n=1 Tax=Colwellia marinimaniae TaxID=1513592 RepID=A0ABQ0MUQ8_9GAMM|nr:MULTISPECIES: DUF5610 domain-containing protein [Colwellia]GAW96098.1 hypothetical protein MTCD1_01708 [Colwellia marinimaniae]
MSSSINPNATFSQNVRSLAKAQDKKEHGAMGQQVSELADKKKMAEVPESIYLSQKKQLNAAIIASSLKFSKTIGDQPLSLLLKTALQGINEALKDRGVEASVENAYDSGIDFSPEATAERIVAFSTQFLASYREQNPQMNEEQSLTAFVDIIRGGIEQGFTEARDILGGFKVLAGDIASNIDKTYELVQQGLQSFVDSFSKNEEE